tara:strand:- start:848 stop:1849 length:1002 start_codon:yes stop_codon:yes gene_type:complete
MAFLDNSGDIILDAVLTETGRRKMAAGDFKIVKFALGDDEIDYSLYNLNHPSGNAYYDLEILQTPIMEAATQVGLNSSLMTIANNDILYMPSLLLNEKLETAVKRQNNTVYVAVNAQTKASLDSTALGFGSGYALLAGQRGGSKFITIESCVNNADIAMTRANQNTYITSKNMLDTSAKITFDNNFITFPLASPATTQFSTGGDGAWTGTTVPLRTLTNVSPGSRTGYSTAIGAMSRASIFTPSEGEDITTFVQSVGIVGSMAYLNVSVDPALTTTKDQTASTKWAKFGNTGVTVTGLSATRTYSTIALDLEITTNSSAATINIPITLIKRDT